VVVVLVVLVVPHHEISCFLQTISCIFPLLTHPIGDAGLVVVVDGILKIEVSCSWTPGNG